MKLRASPRRALALLALLFAAPVAAQQPATAPTGGTTITGVVKDVLTGLPIANANVTIKNTARGVVTNEQGRYTLTGVPSGLVSIEARRIPYTTNLQSDVRVSGSGTLTVNFDMSQSGIQLEAITSTATTDPISGKKAPFAITTLTSEAFPVPTTGAATALQSKVAGVSVIRGSGDPNDEAWVQLRGMSSPFKDNGPLWVIDGIPLNTTQSCTTAGSCSIGNIRTTDIESLDIANIEIIKGAAAAAQYGSSAAGGVISITTNRGKDVTLGKSELTARSDYGYDLTPPIPDQRRAHVYLTNARGQWISSNGLVVPKSSRVVAPDLIQDNLYVKTYQPVKQALQPNVTMQNQVKLQQNSASTNFSLSYNRTQNPGIVRNGDGTTNQNVRFNVQHQFKDNLDLTVGLNHSRRNEVPNQVSFGDLFNWDPDVNLLRSDPLRGTEFIITPDSALSTTNPLYLQSLRQDVNRRAATDFSAQTNFRPTGWLTLNAQVGTERVGQINNFFTPAGLPDGSGDGFTDGTLSFREVETRILSAQTGATVLQDFGRLTARVNVRGEMQRDENLRFQATGEDFNTTGVQDLAAATTVENSSTITESRVNSFVTTSALDYGGRYAVNTVYRHEGNSRFGPKHRWNNFYGAGASWMLNAESWYPSFLNPLTLFKLRYNYGSAGTKPDFVDQYEVIDIQTGGFFIRNGLGNADLAPEMKYDHEMGADWIYKNKISLSYTYVNTRTKGAIVGVEAPATSGFNTYTRNAGGTHSSTQELTIEGNLINRPRGLRWNMSANASRSTMDVDFYGRTCYFETPATLYRCPGVPITEYWGFVHMRSLDDLAASRRAADGSSDNQWAVDNNGYLVPVGLDPTTCVTTGTTTTCQPYRVTDGKARNLWGTTVVIDGTTYAWGIPQYKFSDSANALLQTRIGDWQPDFEYGFTNRFTYGQMNFSFLFGGQVGGDIYDRSSRSRDNLLDSPLADQVGVPDSLQKGWVYFQGANNGGLAQQTYSDSYIRSATYVKLREATASYTLRGQDHGIVRRIGADRVNLQLLGSNLWRFMPGYKGIDPEGFISLNGGIRQRMDILRYPPTRRFTGSVTLVF
jgi:TonB-linked SusC/RagA family outer membrane protein